jgi:uncharacterized repeat protein (TIGR03803 family)
MRTSILLCPSGSALVLSLVVLAGAASAAKFKVLHTFAGAPNDGNEPNAAFISDDAGYLYSTTIAGGASDWGTVFRMSPNGTVTILYSFAGSSDGGSPDATLANDRKGNLYGTTIAGGTNGNGTVFKLKPDGKETVLYSFGTGSDGAEPFAGVVRDNAGSLYGTTFAGGTAGDGTVYKIALNGSETILHSFNGSDGSGPEANVIIDSAGNLCGTTVRGGANDDGTVFRIAPDGTFKNLYAFSGSDGANPYGGVIEQKPGLYYGTTGGGGTDQAGVVYRLTDNGKQRVVYEFTGRQDGGFPSGELIFDPDGALYGTTVYGGNDGTNGCANRGGCGVVYRLSPKAAKLTVLHAFTSGSDGASPEAALLIGQNGYLYGTAGFGGADNDGTVYRIK